MYVCASIMSNNTSICALQVCCCCCCVAVAFTNSLADFSQSNGFLCLCAVFSVLDRHVVVVVFSIFLLIFFLLLLLPAAALFGSFFLIFFLEYFFLNFVLRPGAAPVATTKACRASTTTRQSVLLSLTDRVCYHFCFLIDFYFILFLFLSSLQLRQLVSSAFFDFSTFAHYFFFSIFCANNCGLLSSHVVLIHVVVVVTLFFSDYFTFG